MKRLKSLQFEKSNKINPVRTEPQGHLLKFAYTGFFLDEENLTMQLLCELTSISVNCYEK